MGQTFSSPQNIIKASVNLFIRILSTVTTLIGSSIKKLIGNIDTGSSSGTMASITKFIDNFIEQTYLLIKQIETTTNNIVNVITNTYQINAFHSLVYSTTELPGDDTEETELSKVLENESDSIKLLSISPKYDSVYDVELIANYFSWLKDGGALNRKSTQVLTYKFSIPDQNSVDTLEDLVVVPKLLNFEDRTPPIINGTTVPSPLSEIALHLKYVFTKPGTGTEVIEVIYDPETDSTFPVGVTILKGLHVKASLIFDRSVLSSTNIVTEKLQLRANINVKSDRVPDSATSTVA